LKNDCAGVFLCAAELDIFVGENRFNMLRSVGTLGLFFWSSCSP
jgi:hypothetical protein